MGWTVSGRRSSSNTMPLRSSETNSSHPKVTDINAYGDHLGVDGRREWFMNTLNDNSSQAKTNESTVWDFTGGGFTDMHTNVNTVGNDIIDAIIDNPQSPVYTGEQYRGLKIWKADMQNGVTPKMFVDNIIKSGVWREEGATSFSATQSVAHSFAGWNGSQDGYVSVVVQYQNPTTGMPIKHLSRFTYEDEVLHSRKQMTKGYKIVDSQWMNGNKKVIITIRDR